VQVPINNVSITSSQCTGGYFEKSIISNNYICKPNCSAINKYHLGNIFTSVCSSPYNKVGLSNECKSSCTASNGQYQLTIENLMIK